MSKKLLLLLSFIILALAAGLRFINLNSLPIFADESIYIRWSQVMKAEASLRFLPLTDGKQPLYMWAVIPFLKFISDPLLAGRLLSGLMGVGTVVGVGFAAYLLFANRRLSLMAGLIWAVIPYGVFFERMALADAMLTFFIIWAFNFMALALMHSRLDMAMISGFALGFAWLTKTPAEFSFLLLPFLSLLIKRRRLLISIGLLLVAYVIAFAMYNILRLGPEFSQIAIRNKDYVFSFSEVLRHPIDPLIPHLKDSLNFYWYLITPVGLLFALVGLFDWRSTHLRQRLILAAWVILPIFAQSLIAKAFTARYLLFTVPFAVILMAHGLEHIGQKTKAHLLVIAGLLILVGFSLWQDKLLIFSPDSAPLPRIERSGYLEEWTAGFGLREVSQTVAKASRSGPVVVGSEGFFGTPFSALQLYLNSYPNVRIVGVGTYIGSVDPKLFQALGENQVFLVVNSSRFHIDQPETQGLRLLASYPKGFRPDGTRESLLFFQVQPK